MTKDLDTSCLAGSNQIRSGLCIVLYCVFHNVLSCNKSILVHFRPVFIFTESSHVLFNIMLNINVMTSETEQKKDQSLYCNQADNI